MNESGPTLLVDTERWPSLRDETRRHLWRSDLYRTLAIAFGDPLSRRACPPSAADGAAALGRLADVAEMLPDECTLAPACRTLAQQREARSSKPEACYTRIFGHTISAECPPYETQYGSSMIFQQAQRLADIAGFYRAFGLRVLAESRERPDHISVELEFLSFLVLKQAMACEMHDHEAEQVIGAARRRFVKEHLAPWVPSFADRLGRKAGGGFYAALASVLRRAILGELELLGIAANEVGLLEPAHVDFEPQGGCFDCGPVGEPVLRGLHFEV